VISRFQSLPFKCTLYRYIPGSMMLTIFFLRWEVSFRPRPLMMMVFQFALDAVGLYKLNPVDPGRLKATGFNPRTG
jgi:hypothetical protein